MRKAARNGSPGAASGSERPPKGRFGRSSPVGMPRASSTSLRRAGSRKRQRSRGSSGDGLEPSRTQPPRRRCGQDPAHGYLLPSSSCASATTRSGSKPNFCWSAFSGAEAPKVCMPITRPSEPT